LPAVDGSDYFLFAKHRRTWLVSGLEALLGEAWSIGAFRLSDGKAAMNATQRFAQLLSLSPSVFRE
jgi:hypothetical protein